MRRNRSSVVSLAIGAAVFAAALLTLLGAGSDPPAPAAAALHRVVRLDGTATALAWGSGAVWAVTGQRIDRVDPVTLRVTRTAIIPSLCGNSQIAVGIGSVWVTSGRCAAQGTLTQIDPTSLRIVSSAVILNGFAGAVAVWRKRVWVSVPNGGPALWQFSPDGFGERLSPVQVSVVGSHPADVRYDSLLGTPRHMWAAVDGPHGGLARIDLAGGLARIDPAGRELTAHTVFTRVPQVETPVVGTQRSLWTAFGRTLVALDGSTGALRGAIPGPQTGILAIAGGDAGVWVAAPRELLHGDTGQGSLTRVAPLRDQTSAVVLGGGYVWVANTSGTISPVALTPR